MNTQHVQRQPGRHFTDVEKVATLKRHLLENAPISNMCDEFRLYPTQFHA